MIVLVAEDEVVSRTLLTRAVRAFGHEVLPAADGDEAWTLFQSHEVSAVITDWMMPGCDGLELIRRIRGARLDRYVYIVMITARSQTADLVAGLEAGADDFVTKPFQVDELRARLRAGERILDLERTLADQHRQLAAAHAQVTAANARMRSDLEAAAVVQQSLLPQREIQVPRLRSAWLYRPCDELAGDVFNLLPLSDRELALYVLDVSSHGVPAALLAVTLSRVLSPASDALSDGAEGLRGRLASPAHVVEELNRRFPLDPRTGQYFTLLYGVLDLPRGELRYVQAGHPSPILISGGVAGPLDPSAGGLPIGFLPDATYLLQRRRLVEGDRLYLYTDGIVEARSPEGELFGEARLVDTLASAREGSLHDSIETVRAAVHAWVDGGSLRDDLSLVGVELQAAPVDTMDDGAGLAPSAAEEAMPPVGTRSTRRSHADAR